MNGVFDPVLAASATVLLLMIVAALAVARLGNLFTAILFSAVFSLLGSVLFLLVGAPDVAFVQACVGAGGSTALYLATLVGQSDRTNKSGSAWQRGIGAGLAVAAMAAVFVIVVPFTPPFGDPLSAPATGVGAIYTQSALIDIGVSNVVTAVWASYRGIDAFVGAILIFATGLAVAAILPRDRRSPKNTTPSGQP